VELHSEKPLHQLAESPKKSRSPISDDTTTSVLGETRYMTVKDQQNMTEWDFRLKGLRT